MEYLGVRECYRTIAWIFFGNPRSGASEATWPLEIYQKETEKGREMKC
jgi:hypothetical protein